MAQINYEFKSGFNERYSLVSRKILRMLSENSRASVSDISKAVQVSRKTVVDRMRRLEEELGVRYTLELNEDVLGLINPHIIAVKFGEKPDYERVRKIFQRSHIAQFVATVKGSYDLLIYANAASRDEYVHWDKGTQVLLSDYKVSWNSSEVAHKQLGYFPLRNETIDRLNLPQKYKDMIRLLNVNSRASFQDMSKDLNMHFNTLAYNFRKLLKMNYIKRFTIAVKPVENTTVMSYLAKLTLTNAFEQCAATARKALMYDDDNSLLSRYSFCSQLIGSHDFFAFGIFDNEKVGYNQGVMHYKKTMASQKIKLQYGVIGEVLIGSMPLRSIDNRKEYNTLKWTPDLVEE